MQNRLSDHLAKAAEPWVAPVNPEYVTAGLIRPALDAGGCSLGGHDATGGPFEVYIAGGNQMRASFTSACAPKRLSPAPVSK